jgi:D-glycero-D-manno-heptose 1,7-bisphosphate phosphatase
MSPAVFLDRDDTLIHCNELPVAPPPAKRGDHVHPHLVELLPGVLDGCTALKQAGFKLIVISNQGAVARGAASLSLVEEIHDRMRNLLRVGGVSIIDAVYYCPFYPEGLVPRWTREHPWRKPAPGMIHAAAAELDLDLFRSWLIGDADRDIQSGIAAGIPPQHCLLIQPESPIPDITAAAARVLSR